MGSGQSTPSVGNPDHSATVSVPPKDGETTKPKKKRNKKSIDYQCRKQKRAWSQCVSDHYQKKFLPGKSLEPEEDCDDLFETFRECYMKGMLKQREEKGMTPPAKDSVLHEFMEEEGMVDDDK
mmetsp:Transcript_12446/g.25699  ORF Transcript_12446/g.25699 Transcript_12446/m.25699 type:complete len:123 (+) Transcript_12446:101-469(+)